jgi:glycerate kinase
MTVLVCPDSFKDCARSAVVAAALARGVRRAWPRAAVYELPLADGGEGTVDALVSATGGEYQETRVHGPLGDRIEARWGVLGDGATAVMEMAAASGLELVPPPQRDPRLTSSRDTGELLRAALDHGARHIILGIGGSATNDGGAGMAQALGVKLRDERGQDLAPGGAALARLAQLGVCCLDTRIRDVRLEVACDVTNPLCGPRGASAVYGPQKGASPVVVAELDAALDHWAKMLRSELGKDVADTPGAGAAGGLGAGLLAFCGATLRSGIDLVLEAVDFDRHLAGADLIITGEGRIDASTLEGKTICGVLRRAHAAGVPVVAVGGSVALSPRQLADAGLLGALALPNRPMTLAEAVAEVETLLVDAAETIIRLVRPHHSS